MFEPRVKEDIGTSLPEVLVSLAIIALAVGISSIGFLPSNKAREFKQIVYSTQLMLSNARLSAQASGQNRKVHFDLENKALRSDHTSDFQIFPDEMNISITTAQEQSVSENTFAISFFPTGQSSGGIIKLSENNHSAEILVNWINGTIKTSIKHGEVK